MTNRKLRPWVKYTLLAIISVIILISIYQLFTLESTNSTPGNYTCRGKIIQICSGSKEVATYLGV